MLIIRRSKLYYTASVIITLVGGRPVHRLCTGKSPTEGDGTRRGIIQLLPPDDEQIVLEICRGI